ncbi:hypothetical protein [Agarivorans sp. DSG3-1]|uniref:hypothetical protein n=1 Tax=Agarivorans sp. DSG3-1 TaxID=3342249 RepID=UPI00398F74B6
MKPDHRLAILISGPLRYIDRVICSLEASDIPVPFDFFIHVWKEDTSNKKRTDETNLSKVFQLSQKCQTLIIDSAPENKDIKERYGEWTDTHSTVGAMFGMFSAINKLIHCVDNDPSGSKYTHVLRMRTDISLLQPNFFKGINWASNKIYLSDNKVVQPAWISDHIMLARVDDFKSIWKFDGFKHFEKNFSLKARNPEFFLKFRVRKSQVIKQWVRYEDYHVVYNPPKDTDPEILNNIQIQGGLDSIFNLKLTAEQKKEIKIHNDKLASHYIGYYKTKYLIKRFFKRLRNKQKAV